MNNGQSTGRGSPEAVSIYPILVSFLFLKLSIIEFNGIYTNWLDAFKRNVYTITDKLLITIK